MRKSNGIELDRIRALVEGPESAPSKPNIEPKLDSGPWAQIGGTKGQNPCGSSLGADPH